MTHGRDGGSPKDIQGDPALIIAGAELGTFCKTLFSFLFMDRVIIIWGHGLCMVVEWGC